MKKIVFERFRKLKTTEEKLFWLVAPLAAVIGLISFFVTVFLCDAAITYIANILCVIISCVMILFCVKQNNNVRICYPLLCIIIGGLYAPLLFVVNGGFYSGMPIFCAIFAILCSFCYEKLWRIISFSLSVLSTMTVFFLVKLGMFDTLVLEGQNFQTDIIWSYVLVSFGMFIIISLVIDENTNFSIKESFLNRYVSKDVQNSIQERLENQDKDIRGSTEKVAVMFFDISHFTTVSEKLSPEDVPKYLDVFLSVVERRITENGGTVDKFIGDCAMAYWLDRKGDGKVLFDAVRTFFDIKDDIYSKEDAIYRRFGVELNFQSGLSYGPVVVGDIGSANRKDFTVIGDMVNTASRLEGEAIGGELIVSENVAEMLKKAVDCEFIKELYLKGKMVPTKIYRINGMLEGAPRKISEPEKAETEKYRLYICGCRGTMPVSGLRYAEFGGDTTCYVIKNGKHAIVIDCGTGLKNAKNILLDCTKIDVLLTHVHYDHIFGLLTPDFPDNTNIFFYGFFSGWNGMDTLKYFSEAPYWPVNSIKGKLVDIELNKPVNLSKNETVTFFRSDHVNNACVLKLELDGKKICIFTDCKDACLINDDVAADADIIISDGTYDRISDANTEMLGHGTWQDAVEYAKRLNIKKLIVAHHSPDATDSVLLEREKQARELMPSASFARVGDCYRF